MVPPVHTQSMYAMMYVCTLSIYIKYFIESSYTVEPV